MSHPAPGQVYCCEDEDNTYEDDSETVLCGSCGEWTCKVKCRVCDEVVCQSSCCG